MNVSAVGGPQTSMFRTRTVTPRSLPVRPQVSKADASTESRQKIGFRWDATLQRWVRDKRVSSEVWANVPTMKPKTGLEYTIWPVVHTTLVDKDLQTMPVEEAEQLADSGKAVFVDVRPSHEYEQQHLPGAVNLPLYRAVETPGFYSNVKRFVMATAFAMTATERNPEFAANAQEALSSAEYKGKKLIVYCGMGGTLKVGVKTRNRGIYDDPDRQFGRESRSLKGCYELFLAGFDDVSHLAGGLSGWRHSKRPLEGERAGKGNMFA